MNKSILLGALFVAIFSFAVAPAYAQYMGQGSSGTQDGGHPSMSLENTLQLAAEQLLQQYSVV